MRIAEICPTCATYINASCILYDGPYLPNLDVDPLDSLFVILGKIDTLVAAVVGTVAPTAIPDFIGQTYINTTTGDLYIGLSDTLPDWGLVATVSTTTTLP